jgi:RNA polymerase sigma factor (sigma-70 family)
MSAFQQTRWSLISAIRGSDEPLAVNALDELCRIYWPVVFAFVARALHNEEEAKDVTQDFFADLLALRRIELADRREGKFRTFLLKHLEFFLKDHIRKCRAQKRGGGMQNVPAEELTEAELPVSLPDTSSFDVSWATAVVKEAVRLLEKESGEKESGVSFDELKGFLPGFQAGQTLGYSELAARHGLSEATLRVRVNRFRGRFKELLNAVLADTVSSAADLENERQALLGGLLRSMG